MMYEGNVACIAQLRGGYIKGDKMIDTKKCTFNKDKIISFLFILSINALIITPYLRLILGQ